MPERISCLLLCLLLGACQPDVSSTVSGDEALQQRIASILAHSTDLPETLSVAVVDGIVTISGSLDCEECGGNATPGTTATIQQSLGAVVRAVPGVTRVDFALNVP